jgi:hypothetical protein
MASHGDAMENIGIIATSGLNGILENLSTTIIESLNWAIDAAKIVVGTGAAIGILMYFFSAAKE